MILHHLEYAPPPVAGVDYRFARFGYPRPGSAEYEAHVPDDLLPAVVSGGGKHYSRLEPRLYLLRVIHEFVRVRIAVALVNEPDQLVDLARAEIVRAHVLTPVTVKSR